MCHKYIHLKKENKMKRIVLMLTAILLLGSCNTFAQMKNVRKAKARLNAETPNLVEAREAIEPALIDSISKKQADTWFTAGKIYYKLFDQEQKKEWAGSRSDGELMAQSLSKAYNCFVIADSLDQEPNEKGRVRPKYRKSIVEMVKAIQNGFINSGSYYFKKEDFQSAIRMFEYYLDYPNLKFWTDEERLGYQKDTMIDDIQYYCGASASQDGDSETAIKYFTMLLDVYQPQEEMYQFLIYEYGRLKDTTNLMELYKIGVQKFPENPFYARSLINEYLNKNDLSEALIWIDKAIEEDSLNATLWDVKGRIFESKDSVEEAERCFLVAIKLDPNFEPALGNIGRIYYNRAVEELDRVNAIRDDRVYRREKEKMKAVFEKPLPYMEKAHELNPDERDYIIALRGIYYNLGKGYEKKYEKMDVLMKESRKAHN